MSVVLGLLFGSGAYPFWQAWRANRRTSLLPAVYWALAAWLAWGGTFAAVELGQAGAMDASRYLALCLTACAGVAVLGARRPGVEAWNLVVVGLLAVLLLPMAEGFLTGTIVPSGGFRLFFLGATIAIGVLNYLPTRLGLAGMLLAIGCAGELAKLMKSGILHMPEQWPLSQVALVLVPWAAWGVVGGVPPSVSEINQLWFGFRDRYGLVWAQRLREQFNNGASHAGWPVVLRWQGLQIQAGSTPPDADLLKTNLLALMKRFGVSEDQ
jgi:hypothetical protein